ncbi:BZ3500_MvSof-1268-A1-R1_Chr10-2g03001 [Microbotryum saponariae]|uniref:BZ3500_MvSof-1268-A1-R1_Chr10-2g03001 protein n=1 Tax=Microbotryum saponariae TaxID=289078 RepID=A0A2X0LB41_9BASI|nr:BZ3501_MvSof-1269-A2-R1_Chr10-2g02587 [Microbotryum saponariae]SDA01908.1 BZ3500_MvSof-1268-A1-R1_Chr10-2g03001 [Microbotryum saponariae]
MDPDEPLSAPIIKRRNLKGVRPSSSSSSSLRSWRGAQVSDPRPDQAGSDPTTTGLATVTPNTTMEVGSSTLDDGEEDAVVFRRTKNKKTPRGAVLAASTKPPIKSSLRIALSIADEDEEADSFVLTKRTPSSSSSTAARKLLSVPDLRTTHTTQAALPSNLDQATLSPQKPSLSSVYSSEYLQELKSATLSTPPPPPPPPPASTSHDDLTLSKFASRFATSDDPHPESSPIPTTAAIASAKARRERLRTQGPSADFISLQIASSSSSKTGSQSRLVREDDDLGDGIDHRADFEGSLPLGKKATIVKRREEKEGMMRLIDEAEEEMEEEADDEVREWEERQLARVNERRGAQEHTSTQPTYVPTPIPQTSTLPTLSNVQARLSAGLNTLESSRTLDVAALNHFEKERNELDTQEGELRSEAIRIEQKNRWFNDFENFIEDVAAFLDEKFPALEKIEKENLAIQRERYEIVSRRRFEDDSDDVALFTGASVPSAFSLDPKASAEDDEDKDGEEEEVDEMGRSTRRTEDRFGPRSGARVARRSARERRLENRKALYQPNGIASTAEEDSAMWTDDDLISADSADLADALTSLQDLRKTLFEDVRVDDFRDPNLGIRKKFEEWRSTYREDYENAFGGLALVGVWEFWARVEMALWNPFGIDQLARTPSGLDSYHWHSSLTAFGHASHPPNGEADDDSHMDEDDAPPDESAEVVNALVTSVVIPRLIALAKASYDPWSKKQTMKALALVDEVSYCVETTSPKFEVRIATFLWGSGKNPKILTPSYISIAQSLVQVFLNRLQLGITQASTLILPHLNQLSLPSNAFDPSTFLARERFLLRQLKLLQNAHKWRRYARNYRLPLSTVPSTTMTAPFTEIGSGASFDELLQRDLVAKVMLPVIEASWSTGGEKVAGKVLMVFQEADWIPALRRRLEGGGE